MVPYQCVGIAKDDSCLSNTSLRGSERSSTPMPGVTLRSPLRDLIPIELSSGPSQDKGKGRAIEAMDEGKLERAWSVSVTISKYEGAFHGGSLAFIYNWIDDTHGDSSLEGPRCQNHSADDAVHAHAKGPFLERENGRPPSHPKRRKWKEEEGTVDVSNGSQKVYIFALGARDVDGLSNAWVHIQPH